MRQTVAVATMRIAGTDELEAGSIVGRWSSPGGAAKDKTKQ